MHWVVQGVILLRLRDPASIVNVGDSSKSLTDLKVILEQHEAANLKQTEVVRKDAPIIYCVRQDSLSGLVLESGPESVSWLGLDALVPEPLVDAITDFGEDVRDDD